MNKKGKNLTTREEVVKKAAKLFAQKGYFGVSMQDIAETIKVTKAALYYHFPSKDKLYNAVLEVTFLDLWYELKKSFNEGRTPWDKLLNTIEAYLLFALNRPETTLFFREEASVNDKETERIVGKFRKQLLSFFKQIIKMESKGRQLASQQVIFLATLLLTILGKSIIIATLPPRLVAKQVLNLILPPSKPKHGRSAQPRNKQVLLTNS